MPLSLSRILRIIHYLSKDSLPYVKVVCGQLANQAYGFVVDRGPLPLCSWLLLRVACSEA